jgi:Ca2+-transporting ATPase
MAITFVSLVLIQFSKAYSFRSDSRSVTHQPFANKWLNRAIVWELILLVLIVSVPFLQVPFGTYTLSPSFWIILTALALTVTPALEFVKWLHRRGRV